MDHPLKNIFWEALSGSQIAYSEGTAQARRFAPGLAPIIAFHDQARPRFDQLEAHCAPGEAFYCDGWAGPTPPGWQVVIESTMVKMVWDAAPPEPDPYFPSTRLDSSHAIQVAALVDLTRPGPIGPRSMEMGEFQGYFEEGKLIAMAGERVHAGPYRELSGVCTHPDAQGQGLARRLMNKLIRQQLAREESPFLHVLASNERARGLYLGMGFVDVHSGVVRVIARL